MRIRTCWTLSTNFISTVIWYIWIFTTQITPKILPVMYIHPKRWSPLNIRPMSRFLEWFSSSDILKRSPCCRSNFVCCHSILCTTCIERLLTTRQPVFPCSMLYRKCDLTTYFFTRRYIVILKILRCARCSITLSNPIFNICTCTIYRGKINTYTRRPTITIRRQCNTTYLAHR